jgi:hypothetical protein
MCAVAVSTRTNQATQTGPLRCRGGVVLVDYLEVPVLFRYRHFSSRYAPVLTAGPVWRVALSSEMYWEGSEIDDWADESDLAFAFGIGIEPRLGNYLVSVDVIYSRSFGSAGDGEYLAFDAAVEGVDLQVGFEF